MIHRSEGDVVASTNSTCSKFEPEAGDRQGFVVLGSVVHVNNHFLTDGAGKKHRLVRISVAVSWAKRRAFDDRTGEETDATPFGKHHLQRTGFLSTLKTEKRDPGELGVAELKAEMSYPDGFQSFGSGPEVHPAVPGRFDFFGTADVFKSKDFKQGDVCKLKTRNRSCLLETASKFDELSQNFSGEDVAGGWGDRLLEKKGAATAKFKDEPLPGDDKEGVAEDEWDD